MNSYHVKLLETEFIPLQTGSKIQSNSSNTHYKDHIPKKNEAHSELKELTPILVDPGMTVSPWIS